MEREKNIYVLGCKLKTATEENTRFKWASSSDLLVGSGQEAFPKMLSAPQGIDVLQKSIRQMTDEWQVALRVKGRMQQAVDNEKGEDF